MPNYAAPLPKNSIVQPPSPLYENSMFHVSNIEVFGQKEHTSRCASIEKTVCVGIFEDIYVLRQSRTNTDEKH